MAKTQKCPACKIVNEPNVLKCDCGYDFVNKVGGSKRLYKTANRSSRKKIDWSKGTEKKTVTEGIREILILSIIIYGVYWIFYSPSEYESTEKPNNPEKTNAFSAAQEYVKLYIPKDRAHTIKFPFLDFSGMETSENRFQIKSYVNFQNVYGADIKWAWSGIMDYNGGDVYDNNNWELVQLYLNNELVYIDE